MITLGLSSDILKDFADLTKQPSDSNQEYTAYGTIVEYTGAFYVKLDGSEHLTPMTTTANVKNGDRVVVSLKNHTATVIGNTTDPSASSMVVKEMDTRVSGLVADNITVNEKLAANQAVIDDLTAYDLVVKGSLEAHDASILELETGKIDADEADLKYATIVSLEAANAVIGTLESDLGDFKVLTAGQFVATEAIIKELQTEKLSAKDIEGKFANIDFSNISKATMESFYATSGLIENVSIGDATISGRLVGVVISGDLIEGGTVVAEKLVIQGTDGLYYKLNTDGMTTEAEQTEYNSLNGSILAKKSITASKIDVKDLVAFGATIGGFVIADNSIYSGVKESVDNTTGGIYLDKEGQVCFGDTNDFLKCYKNQNGDYKLEISADSILVGSDKKNVRTVIGDIEADVEEVRAKAVAAQSTADTAKTNAATAQTAANNARSTADTAKANATAAQNKADEAKQAADDAQKAADDADEKLAQAQAELATAQQNLADVTSRVDVTEEEIEAAQAAVIAAQTKADEAVTNAATAQSTANTAKSNAEVAQNVANTAKSNAEAAQSAANEAKTIADTAKTNAANAQKAADDAQADVDALTTRVNTAETQIDQNSEAIKLRATKTEVDERLNGYYSKSQTDALLKVESDKIAANVTEIDALGTRMSTVEQTADGLTIRLANTEDELENLEIGGRNLLRYTGEMPITYKLATGISSYGTVKPLTDTGEGVKFIVPEGGKGGFNIPLVSDGAVQNGEEITISFDYRGNMTDLGAFYFLQRTSPNVSVNTFPDAIISEEEWQHYTYTFSSNYANDRTCYAALLFYTGSTEAGKWIEIKKGSLKLERGNRATDWSPAPEDVDSDISNAAKTATNFMKFSDTGLVIADMTGDELGNNVLIDTDSVDIRSGDVVLASYGASRTSLGKGSKNSVIDMCDESLLISVSNEENGYDDAHIYSHKYPISMHGVGYVTTRAEYTDYKYYGSAALNAQSHRPNNLDENGSAIDSSSIQGKVTLYAQTREKWWMDDGTYIGDTYDTSYVKLSKGSLILCVTQDSFLYTGDGDIIEGEDSEAPKVSITLSQDFNAIYMRAPNGLHINNHQLSAFITYQGTSNGWYYEASSNNIIKMYRKISSFSYHNANVLGAYVSYPFNVGTVYGATATVSYDGNTAACLDWNAKIVPASGGYGCNIWLHDASGNFTSTSTNYTVYISIIAECDYGSSFG